ncbi:hypothetical protein [uncultured Flavobacterium sp.]|jgi:hypothetical protein|uniref:hypothetical protein n=1 Tax=uncultured Flavobacterium sp. TaxID=165435 RepID=UPI00259AC93B|nr:hypothetical protein [uncultured Flavobacterium sp.]
MMKNLIIFIFFVSCKVFATPQIPDKLIYNGKEYEWNSFSPGHKYIEDKKNAKPKDAIETSANYGTYIMTYTIENDSLFLTDIEILIEKDGQIDDRSVFKDFFPAQSKIFMDFYSNIQTFPYGKEFYTTKNHWTDIYFENYLVFEFKNGRAEKSYDLSHRDLLKLKKKLFSRFKKTVEYDKAVIEQIDNLNSFNEFRQKKYKMDEYLKLIIFRLVKTLKV